MIISILDNKTMSNTMSLTPLTEEEKPVVKLIGKDGNVFSIIGNVSKSLKKAGLSDYAEEFRNRVFNGSSYDHVLNIVQEYVEIE